MGIQSTCDNIIAYQSRVCQYDEEQESNSYTGDTVLVKVPEEMRLENLEHYFGVWLLRRILHKSFRREHTSFVKGASKIEGEHTIFFLGGLF